MFPHVRACLPRRFGYCPSGFAFSQLTCHGGPDDAECEHHYCAGQSTVDPFGQVTGVTRRRPRRRAAGSPGKATSLESSPLTRTWVPTIQVMRLDSARLVKINPLPPSRWRGARVESPEQDPRGSWKPTPSSTFKIRPTHTPDEVRVVQTPCLPNLRLVLVCSGC